MRELEATLLTLEKQLMHARLKDYKTILSEEFCEFGTSGKVYDKNAQLSLIDDEGKVENPYIITSFHVKSLSQHSAHVTYHTESKSNGSKSLRSSIWRYEHTRWYLYFHQGTRSI
ncbi:DUF4440 domain-containing protein [Bacillus sp. FJAT-50079]|uniref:nuclear transport factor 2 family protein n=1 Tax=Bacillus sp. FJAT-50079 TaxID=2833577 RepID=UPI001BCA4C4C|nr:DUF4440 domain-containing protein [Bacillus sp. FJAT-50079]MBS4207550.1 DUF4440 domain-containing protein [Bacillus sp. FJAT-50079]